MLGVEQTIINLLLRAMFDIIAEPGSKASAQACISLCSSALAQGCELLASSFLPASVQAAHADSDFPDLVQSELQRLLLSVKTRCYSLACGPLEEGMSLGLALFSVFHKYMYLSCKSLYCAMAAF